MIGSTVILNFRTISKTAVFSWIWANLIPKQILGPSPNGIKTPFSLKTFVPPFSMLNLSGMKSSGSWKYSSKTTKKHNYIEFLNIDRTKKSSSRIMKSSKSFRCVGKVFWKRLTRIVMIWQSWDEDSKALFDFHFVSLDTFKLNRLRAFTIGKC